MVWPLTLGQSQHALISPSTAIGVTWKAYENTSAGYWAPSPLNFCSSRSRLGPENLHFPHAPR